MTNLNREMIVHSDKPNKISMLSYLKVFSFSVVKFISFAKILQINKTIIKLSLYIKIESKTFFYAVKNGGQIVCQESYVKCETANTKKR